MTAPSRALLIDTAGRQGAVGIASGDTLIASHPLDDGRRHARDLASRTHDLLQAQGWQPRDLTAVVVALGPGSYTGLRVGIAAAQALAFVVGCPLIGVPTFRAIALQSPPESRRLEVVADALQGEVYHQAFTRLSAEPRIEEATPLAIIKASEWLTGLASDTWVGGPAAPRGPVVATLDSLWLAARLGLGTVGPRPEPLYARGSYAEKGE